MLNALEQYRLNKVLYKILPLKWWCLGDDKWAESDRIQYPGAAISDNSYHQAQSSISAYYRAFYGIQEVDLCNGRTNPDTILYLCVDVSTQTCAYLRSILDEHVEESNRITW